MAMFEGHSTPCTLERSVALALAAVHCPLAFMLLVISYINVVQTPLFLFLPSTPILTSSLVSATTDTSEMRFTLIILATAMTVAHAQPAHAQPAHLQPAHPQPAHPKRGFGKFGKLGKGKKGKSDSDSDSCENGPYKTDSYCSVACEAKDRCGDKNYVVSLRTPHRSWPLARYNIY